MTQLYRHFDSSGQLLYVGISFNAAGRFIQHQRSSDWGELIARVEIETFGSREEAAAAERAAIEVERPIYNKKFSLRFGRDPNQIDFFE